MKLSEYVKNYRTSQELSLRAFAEKCGCSHQYLDKLEKDNIESPSFGQLLKIAKAMGAWSQISMHECMEKHKKRASFLRLISSLMM